MDINNILQQIQQLGLECSGIVAVNQRNLIGATVKETGKQIIPWSVPEDLANFKRITANNILIMGRKTFESLPEPLNGRVHIVITRSLFKYTNINDPTTPVWFINYDSLITYISIAKKYKPFGNLFVIGGTEIFNTFCSICSKWYITLVHTHNNITSDTQYSDFHYFGPPISIFREQYNRGRFSPIYTSRGKDNLQYEFWEIWKPESSLPSKIKME